MTDLPAFLRDRLASDAAWNCSTMPADWAVASGHPDFAAAWRDVTDANACDAAATDGGGLVALWTRDIGDGLPVVDDPRAGDIGVVSALGVEAGAVFTGVRWVVQGTRTLHFLAPEQVSVLKVWRM